MCKLGDIILVNSYKDGKTELTKHSFVVVDDDGGTIRGLNYDIICNVLSSFKSAKQRERKLGYEGNFPIAHDDTVTDPHNDKSGFIKTDQLYYFNTSKLDYTVIGYMLPEVLEMVFNYIEGSDFDIRQITDNL